MRCKYCNTANPDEEGFCSACGSPLQESGPSIPVQRQDVAAITEIQCPHCGNSHPSTIWNCPLTGAELPRNPGMVSQQDPDINARLTMDNGNEISLASSPRAVGRDDFDRILSARDLPYISRQHLTIRFHDGAFYLEDNSSKNGTVLNGIEIQHAGKYKLKNGDRIELGNVVTLTFKTM